MKKIILEMDDNDARKWNDASPAKRNRLLAYLSKLLLLEEDSLFEETEIGYKRPSEKELSKFTKQNSKATGQFIEMINEISKEAAANGLSADKLAELMEWDEETRKNIFG
jgi:ribosomal protein L22